MSTNDDKIEALVTAVKQSRKYHTASEETIRLLAADAVTRHRKTKAAEKAVRKRLHSIMAPYLGDPDYEAAATYLSSVFTSGDDPAIKSACHDLMTTHLSTRERLPLLDHFFLDIFAVTGAPSRLLDIGCGLNPLALRWMGISGPIDYIAYDIHEPRVNFINHYFKLEGLAELARIQDVAIHTPDEQGDVALFLKEMPRFERNYPGSGRTLLQGLKVRHLVISFPAISTHGGRNLTARYRDYLAQLIDGTSWQTTELLFESELVFCIDKHPPREGDN